MRSGLEGGLVSFVVSTISITLSFRLSLLEGAVLAPEENKSLNQLSSLRCYIFKSTKLLNLEKIDNDNNGRL